jgi:hypothetical protein
MAKGKKKQMRGKEVFIAPGKNGKKSLSSAPLNDDGF